MAEFVLGTGRQDSVRAVAQAFEKHLLRVEGFPRRVVVRGRSIDFSAERSDFVGDFTHFTLRGRVSREEAAAMVEVAERHAAVCETRQEEGAEVFLCPPLGQESSPEAIETVDALCKCVTLPEVWRGRGEDYRSDPVSPELIFQAMVQYHASDVHLSPGVGPVFRVDGETRHSELMDELSARQILSLIEDIAPDAYWQEFKEHKQTSFNYHQAGLGYARVSCFIKSEAPHLTFRFLPEVIPSFEDLNVPAETMVELANLHRGLLLVTGMTGSGKTTTVAALIDWINGHRSSHILTIENPVEYVHGNRRSIISQRSLGADVDSFDDAVTGALRHDPDVILIGEMRDSDTIRSAINAAATGHLVISTLHSNTAYEVVNRIVSFFDPVERDLVKLQLRDCLKCVICQRLVPKVGGGRVPALEMLFNDLKPIADGIASGDSDLIRIGIQQTVGHSFLFEVYLHRMLKAGTIDLVHAREFATDESIFNQMYMGTYSVPRLDSLKAH